MSRKATALKLYMDLSRALPVKDLSQYGQRLLMHLAELSKNPDYADPKDEGIREFSDQPWQEYFLKVLEDFVKDACRQKDKLGVNLIQKTVAEEFANRIKQLRLDWRRLDSAQMGDTTPVSSPQRKGRLLDTLRFPWRRLKFPK